MIHPTKAARLNSGIVGHSKSGRFQPVNVSNRPERSRVGISGHSNPDKVNLSNQSMTSMTAPRTKAITR